MKIENVLVLQAAWGGVSNLELVTSFEDSVMLHLELEHISVSKCLISTPTHYAD
jgi:hypothetical protein